METKRKIACAIYTRKSTDEGLDQAFNSLDAQYEACKAYVESQKHEGWKLVPKRYDDGGISGASLERPGIEQLLHDMEQGLVQMIVVYKIDRLTRSLADFARLVERMDAASCSFVSVTQAFNTSTSMGRLTLNVLLSFAQFEREVTAERIRDKIAASKARGMWMGGYPPLGFDRHPDPKTQSLVINTEEASQIETLFALFEKHGRLADVEREAKELGIRSKLHVFANGNTRGGSLMSRGQIHALLSNPVHAGMIRHKDKVYQGLHPAIIEPDRWKKAQLTLTMNARKPRRIPVAEGIALTGNGDANHDPAPPPNHSTKPAASAPLLRGLFFDADGNRLTPTHTRKGKRRYRYYVSSSRTASPSASNTTRLPAGPIEQLVVSSVIEYLIKPDTISRILSETEINLIPRLRQAASTLAEAIKAGNDKVRAILSEVRLGEGSITISFNPSAIADTLKIDQSCLVAEKLQFKLPYTRRRRGNEIKLLSSPETAAPDRVLVKTLAHSHRWLKMLQEGISIEEIATRESHSTSYIRTRLPMALLSPRIQAAILDGRQPTELAADMIARQTLPLCWSTQEHLLGFDR